MQHGRIVMSYIASAVIQLTEYNLTPDDDYPTHIIEGFRNLMISIYKFTMKKLQCKTCQYSVFLIHEIKRYMLPLLTQMQFLLATVKSNDSAM